MPITKEERLAPEAAAAPAWYKSPTTKKTAWAVLIASLLTAVVWFIWFRPYISTDDSRVATTLVRLAPSGMGGPVAAVLAEEGDEVKKGQVLVEIDHRTAQAGLDRAHSRAELAAKELARISCLARENGVSARELDSAKAAAQAAAAEQSLAEVALDNTYLSSPFDGTVVQKSTEVGDIIEPGQVAITVADSKHAWVAANIEETAVSRVKLGQPVKVHVDEGGDLEGKVSEVTAATAAQFSLIPSDNASGNFTKLVQRIPIKVALEPHPGKALRAGQSVEIRIRVE